MRRDHKLLALVFCFVVLLSVAGEAHGERKYYNGVVTMLVIEDGGFFVQFDNDQLDDCRNKRVHITTATIDEVRVERAFSMALASKLSGVRLGVVIDKDINGPGERCDVAVGTSQGASLF